jgi:hypothetical protein
MSQWEKMPERPKMAKNWLKIFKNANILKFDNISLMNESCVDKENSILKIYIQNQMFMDSIKFYRGFNWIYEGFDWKKNWFLSRFRFLLEGIKVLGSNYNFEELIWSNQGLNCIIIKVWRPIRDLIEKFWNQGPNRKRRVNRGAEIDQVRG